MRNYLRIFIAVIVVLSFVLLAKNQAAGAANPGAGNGQTALQATPSALEKTKKQCEDDNAKADPRSRKDKNKDKDKCDDNGTVHPPDDDFDICETGDYSVAGIAVLEVDKLKDRSQNFDCFHAQSQSSSGVQLPSNAGSALSDLVVLSSVGQGSTIQICFAAPPGKKVKIYVFENNTWKAVGTRVLNGVACGSVQNSGTYVLAG